MISSRIYVIFMSVAVLIKVGIDALNEPSATVICTEDGFKPSVRQNYANDTSTSFEVKVGDGSSGCKAQKNVTGFNDGSEVIGVEDLNTNNSADAIPYTKLDAPTCGGRFDNNVDNTTIDYTVTLEVIVSEELRSVIKRQLKYVFNVKCSLTKEASTISGGNWTIFSELNQTGEEKNISGSFILGTKLQFYKTNNYNSAYDKAFQLGAGDRLFVRIEEASINEHFKFVVNKCWSTPDSNPQFNIKDIFFDNKCPIDKTVTFTDPVADAYRYDFSIQAFFFSINKELAIYIHCNLYICKEGDSDVQCTQPTKANCDAKNSRRRRRSVNDEQIEEVTISSPQQIMFDNLEIFVPACQEGYVYDRTIKKCTNERILEIKGIYLNIEWNPLYANTSSEAFIEFAEEKSYQLYALLQTAGRKGIIHGVKVVRATQGSVILDVHVKYAKSTDAEGAITEFEEAIQTTSARASRVFNILNIKQDTTIKYVPIITKTKGNMQNATIIIVVVLLLAVCFILGIIIYKVKQLRQAAPNKNIYSFDNAAVDNIP